MSEYTVSNTVSTMLPFEPREAVLPEIEGGFLNKDLSGISPLSSTPYVCVRKAEYTQLPINFADVPAEDRETVILEDLLSVLLGCDGEYLTVGYRSVLTGNGVYEDVSVSLIESLETSVSQIVKKLLNVAKYHFKINSFAETFSRFGYGLVNHALCSGLNAILRDYYINIAQLEHQLRSDSEFSVHRFWYYFQPNLKTMTALNELVSEILKRSKISEEKAITQILVPYRATGGSILNLLERNMVNLSGDFQIKQTYSFLLSCASVPFISMLYGWIHNGEIKDRYGEFMIQEKAPYSKEELVDDILERYWEQRYTIRSTQVPLFLEPMADKILSAGKFINVARECRASFEILAPLVNEKELVESMQFNTNIYISAVERAYDHANRTLLDLLFKKNKLILRLRSLKRYFFLDQSDFLTHFFDLAFDELVKPRTALTVTKIQSLLELAMRNPFSVTRNDPFKEAIKVSFMEITVAELLLKANVKEGISFDYVAFRRENPISDAQQDLIAGFESKLRDMLVYRPMTGFGVLNLEYKVPFPLSLVLSIKVVSKYQSIFRHILAVKRAETLLVRTWVDHAKLRKRNPKSDLLWQKRLNSLRSRLLNFVQTSSYYICVGVLEQNQLKLEAKLESANTVSEVFDIHTQFLNTCLHDTMLTELKILEIFNKLLQLCDIFSEFCADIFPAPESKKKPLGDAEILDTLNTHEFIFLYHVKLFLALLRSQAGSGGSCYIRLVTHLDYNNYFTNAVLYSKPNISPDLDH